MNKELREKIGMLCSNIEVVMIKSAEISKEKNEIDDPNLKIKKE